MVAFVKYRLLSVLGGIKDNDGFYKAPTWDMYLKKVSSISCLFLSSILILFTVRIKKINISLTHFINKVNDKNSQKHKKIKNVKKSSFLIDF